MENIVPVNFRGVLQCDAYAAYPAFANKREGIELAGCCAHPRRHFHEAREHVPLRANWVLYQIQISTESKHACAKARLGLHGERPCEPVKARWY